MISCDVSAKGGKCKLKGHPADLVAEFTEIISAFDELLSKNIGKENAEKIIAICGKAALAETVEEKQNYGEVIASILTESIKVVDK